MPYSHPEGKDQAAAWVKALNPAHIVDVGAGAGGWHRAVAPSVPGARWTAVEVWEPYITRFRLADRYDQVVQQDVRTLDWAALAPDVVIAGDVLEHMTTEEAVALVDAAFAAGARAVVVAIPIIHYPQGESHGNPFERHVRDDWTDEEVRATWAPVACHVGAVVGTYLIVRDRARSEG